MTVIKVVKHQTIRDGGTIEYRDVNNRRYYTAAPIHKRNGIYSQIPWPGIGTIGWADIEIIGIQLEIIQSF